MCQLEEEISIESPVVKRASSLIVTKINQALEQHQNLCSPLVLDNVISAQRYMANEKVVLNNRYHWNEMLSSENVTDLISYIRVTVTTSPGNGTWESLIYAITKDYKSKSTDVDNLTLELKLGDISRINSYGHQGDCMSMVNRHLEKYCYCTQQSPTANNPTNDLSSNII